MPIALRVTAGPNKGYVFSVDEGAPVSIGRGDGAEVRVSDTSVSRSHCILEFPAGKPVLRDAGSTSGTRVNGKTIVQHDLLSGDVIDIGLTRLCYTVQGPPAETDTVADDVSSEVERLRQLTGSALSHYRIGDAIGSGSSGFVFKALDMNDKKPLALKVYVPEFATQDEELQRFIRSVKTMLPQRHPNLVTLFGGGKTGPYCWMAMEYVEGENLKQTIKRIGQEGKIDWRPAVRVAVGIARGLFYLHSEKIIHRNLSPTNILLSNVGVAKIASLKLAKALSGKMAKNVTKLGNHVLGEIHYQAPEQVGGAGVDGRADIYSLGALIYALLTGRPPFLGPSPTETAAWILRRPPLLPRRINDSIPEVVEGIVLKMLAKRPGERFQSAGELLQELEQLPCK